MKAELDLEYHLHYIHGVRDNFENEGTQRTSALSLALKGAIDKCRKRNNNDDEVVSDLEILETLTRICGDDVTKLTGALSLAMKGAIDKYRKSNNEVVSDLEILEMMVEDIKGMTPNEDVGDAAENIGML
ncbi:hypothetical protein IMZ48_32475 [Candidatus Bathyarchaeota archaeon]|nr:hypothetical protein [Candidatus Bathyarchaeota archaeon]